MLGAALGAARPMALEGERLTVAFPPDAAFVKKKAEANRDVVAASAARADRALARHRLRAARGRRARRARSCSARSELIERLRAEFAAEEVFEEEEQLGMAGQPNMNAMLKQVQKMQADMAKAQEELKNEVVEASAGGGMVTVKISGDLEVKEIKIDPEAVDPEDVELLQDMVLAAVNEARPLRPGAGRLEDERGAGGLGGPAAWADSACPGSRLTALFAAPVNRLITELARLPGIGQRTAQRLAFHILSVSDEEALALADAIREVKETVGHCEICFNLADRATCRICQDERREAATICVVEQPSDVIPIERTGEFPGATTCWAGRCRRSTASTPRTCTSASCSAACRTAPGQRSRDRHQLDDHRRGDRALPRRRRCASARRRSRSPGWRAACRSARTSSTPTRSRSDGRCAAGRPSSYCFCLSLPGPPMSLSVPPPPRGCRRRPDRRACRCRSRRRACRCRHRPRACPCRSDRRRGPCRSRRRPRRCRCRPDHVVPVAALDLVVAVAGADDVVAALAVDRVVAAQRDDHVGALRALELVALVRTDHRRALAVAARDLGGLAAAGSHSPKATALAGRIALELRDERLLPLSVCACRAGQTRSCRSVRAPSTSPSDCRGCRGPTCRRRRTSCRACHSAGTARRRRDRLRCLAPCTRRRRFSVRLDGRRGGSGPEPPRLTRAAPLPSGPEGRDASLPEASALSGTAKSVAAGPGHAGERRSCRQTGSCRCRWQVGVVGARRRTVDVGTDVDARAAGADPVGRVDRPRPVSGAARLCRTGSRQRPCIRRARSVPSDWRAMPTDVVCSGPAPRQAGEA